MSAMETSESTSSSSVMCEDPRFGHHAQWHTLLFEWQVAVEVRVVCPQGCEEDAFETSQSIGRNGRQST